MHMQWVRASSGTLVTTFRYEFHPLLIVQLSNRNVITLAKCLDHQNKMTPTTYTFALSLLFFSFFFSSPSTWSSPCHHHHHHVMIFICFTTWNVLPISWSLWWTRLALRVSSIHKNQTRAFTVEALYGGYVITYGKAWRAKQRAWKMIYGD